METIGSVAAGVCNVYAEPSFRSEVVSQAVLWEQVSLGEERGGFVAVTAEDGTGGWVYHNQIVQTDTPKNLRMVTVPAVSFHRDPDLSTPIQRRAPAGGYICVVEESRECLRVRFPDGETGWTNNPRLADAVTPGRDAMMSLAQSYLGISYLWGGKTTWGFDCSGFVQLVHKLVGVTMRRDAWMQRQDARLVSKDIRDGRPGDLLFFAEGGDAITHVALRLSEDMVIHASGWVRIASLDEDDPLYNPRLVKSFVDVRSGDTGAARPHSNRV